MLVKNNLFENYSKPLGISNDTNVYKFICPLSFWMYILNNYYVPTLLNSGGKNNSISVIPAPKGLQVYWGRQTGKQSQYGLESKVEFIISKSKHLKQRANKTVA